MKNKNNHKPVHAPFPGLGLRSIKTAFAAMLAALLYAFLPGHDPTFACIGAIFGMGVDMETSKINGGNRLFGTLAGGTAGIVLYWIEHLMFPEGNEWIRLPLVFFGIILTILLCLLCKWPGGVQSGGVMLCIILFSTPAHHIDYAFWRVVDTGVGVLLALLINFIFSRERIEKWFPPKAADHDAPPAEGEE